MLDTDDLEHRHTVIFPPAKAFAVDDVLNFLAAAVKNDNHTNALERLPPFPGNWGEYAVDITVEIDSKKKMSADVDQSPKTILNASEKSRLKSDTSEYEKMEFSDYKGYLSDRLLKAVKQGKFELWNWGGDKVIEPPGTSDVQADHQRNYQTKFWWAKMASIRKSDLVSFCAAEKIRVIFESDNRESLISKGEQPMEQAQPSNSIDHQETSTPVPNLLQSLPSQRHELIDADERLQNMQGIPGSIPNVTIGQAAVKAAWLIELANKREATVEEVIVQLQAWANTGNHVFGLEEVIAHGVTWKTKRTRTVKPYVIGSCVKTLELWNKSRRRADSRTQKQECGDTGTSSS